MTYGQCYFINIFKTQIPKCKYAQKTKEEQIKPFLYVHFFLSLLELPQIIFLNLILYCFPLVNFKKLLNFSSISHCIVFYFQNHK